MTKVRFEHSLIRTEIPAKSFRLVRSFVPTGDSRLPLASVWSVAQDAADEAEIPWPVVRKCLLRRAIHRALTYLAVPFSPAVA